MVSFDATILKFNEQGEKTGWTYIIIPADVAQKLKPGNKKSFRVKGKLDDFEIESVALMPMGKGEFIMAINAKMRKGIGKRHGAMLKVKLESDTKPFVFDKELMECLADEPGAKGFFEELPPSHQRYYSKWVAEAKTDATKAKRIAQCISALLMKQHYGEMIRALTEKNKIVI
jgi:hypothetical protein